MDAYPDRPRVLIVDDAGENLRILADMLHGACLPLAASNGLQALKIANADPAPDLILLDTAMPGMNGYEVCTRLKAETRTRNIPVILVAEPSEKHEQHRGIELGAADYLMRPVNPHLMMARIRHQLEISQYRARDRRPLVQPPEPAPLAASSLEELRQENRVLKNLREEFSLLSAALENRLQHALSGLDAAHREMARQAQAHAEERSQADRLRKDLLLQQKEQEVLAGELESLTFAISHDLRAPLRHLVGFSSALQEDFGEQLDTAAQGFLGCITKAAAKLESQIEALLGLSRVARQPMSPGRVDLSRLVRERAASLQDSAPERTANFVVADELRVEADAALLRCLVDHLLGNAWKFTRGKDPATIEFGRMCEGDSEVFYVRDNGVGFDMKYAERLFGAFQRMHRDTEFEGTGVGLATVQRIVRRHGGRIWAEAAVNSGATFFFRLKQ